MLLPVRGFKRGSEVAFGWVFKGTGEVPQMGRRNSTSAGADVGKHSMSAEAGRELGLEAGGVAGPGYKQQKTPARWLHPECSPEAGPFQAGQHDGSSISSGAQVLSLLCSAALISQIRHGLVRHGPRKAAAGSGGACRHDTV